MHIPVGRQLGMIGGIMALAVAVLFLYAPSAFGFSAGIHKDNAPPGEFETVGCIACHGDHNFATGPDLVSWTIMDAEGNAPPGGAYGHDVEYTITITLDEQNGVGEANRAGFNLRTSLGALAAVDGESQVSGDGLHATHVDASRASWTVMWTAPEGDEGPAIFHLFVNDVDGDGAPNPADMVYSEVWAFTDEEHGLPGAAVEEHEAHVGVPLPQYWLGLVALAGMLVIILFSFVYLKFMNPHHTDPGDR